jgi:predicted nucleic acid-binding protein
MPNGRSDGMRVFDAYPLAGLLLGEPVGLASAQLLAENPAGAAICAVNAAEVVDLLVRRRPADPADVAGWFDLWFDAGLRCVPLEWDLAQRAASIRAVHYHRSHRAVSLADCSAIALAEELGAELVTSDAAMVRVAQAEGVAVLPVADSSGRTPK